MEKRIIRVKDVTSWANLIDQSSDKLVVVDCYQDWCGNCEALYPTFLKILMENDDIDERLVIAAASVTQISTRIKASIPSDMSQYANLEKNGCMPMFAFFRNGICVAMVSGADVPQITQNILTHLPPVKGDDQTIRSY